MRRHEALRTRIVARDGQLRQQIDDAPRYSWETLDLSCEAPQEADQHVQRLATELVREDVDLAVGPLLAARLFRLSEQEHVLVLALDHMITDMLSSGILQREIWTLYRSTVRNLPPTLPTLRVQYPDYAVWQQRTHAAWLDHHESYWKNRLSDAKPTVLPFGGADRTDHSSYVTAAIPFGAELTTRLRTLAQRESSSLALVALVIYVAVISRWCAQRDPLVRFLIHGRFRPELMNMVGFIANSLYLRIEIAEERDSFIDVLKRAALELQNAYGHRDLDRVPQLVPTCTTELVFNWHPASESFAHAREVDAGTTIRPYPLHVPWENGFSIAFADGPTGIVAKVGCQAESLQAVTQLEHSLKAFAEEISQRPLERLASVRTVTNTPVSDRLAIARRSRILQGLT